MFGGRLLSLHYSCSLIIRMLGATAHYDSHIRVVLVMKTVSHENFLTDAEWPISWQTSFGQTYVVGEPYENFRFYMKLSSLDVMICLLLTELTHLHKNLIT